MANSNIHSHFESPLRYPGGKACLFPFISKLFYENNLIGTSYAEPYAGGAGLALKLLFNEYVSSIYINDLDKSIYSFWNSILKSNLRFCDWIEDVEISIDNWKYYKNIQKKPENYNEFELAKSTFFLNRTNISGVIKGGIIGGVEQKGKYKIDARFNKIDLIKRFQRIENFKDRIYISNNDGIAFIKRLNRKKENIFIYIDPPYVQKGAELYMNYFSMHDHKILAKNVNLIDKKWLVSYDNNEFIHNLYNEKERIIYKLSQSASNRIGNEIIIFSDKLNYMESLTNLRDPIIL